MHAWHQRSDGTTATIFGQYYDRFVRGDEGWRIARRRMVMNGCDAGFKSNIHPFERLPAPVGWESPVPDGKG